MGNEPEVLFRDSFFRRRPVWQTRTANQPPYSRGHPSCFYRDVNNGRAVLKVKEGAESGQYYVGSVGTGEVLGTSRFEFTFGYVEARVKFPYTRRGAHGSIWLQTTEDYIEHQAEIDIVEYFGNPKKIWHNVYWREPTQGIDEYSEFRRWVEGFDPTEFHTYAVEWTEWGYTFFVDDFVTAMTTDGSSDRPKFLAMSMKVSDYELDDISPPYEDYRMVVDFNRVYDRKPSR